jgi:hypothetical protein
MIDLEWGCKFANDWIEVWNSPGLERSLSHYVDDFEMPSSLTGECKVVRGVAHYGGPA